MQGRKDFTPKLFYELSLDGLVPKDDFYRKVNEYLDLHFLYKSTEQYYGTEGQQSIDPVVFLKILLISYLNNIKFTQITNKSTREECLKPTSMFSGQHSLTT